MIATQNTKLNVVPGGILPVVHVSQYDVNRVLSFTLYDGNGAASIESGTTVTIEGTKPDGNGFQYAGTLSGNVVTVNTTVQMTAVEGTNECKLTLKKGTQTIGSALFLMEVERAGLNENTPISETDLPLIIAEATEQMERAEAAATAAALSETHAATSETNAASSETNAATSEANAALSETNAHDSEIISGSFMRIAGNYSEDSEAYAIGKRKGVDVPSTDPTYHNNSAYWADYARQYAAGGLHYKSAVYFANIPTTGMTVGDMYDIKDDFVTDSRFQDGAGIPCDAGTNIIWNINNKWDIDIQGGSGGHTIVDEEGTELTQRSKLQFKGAVVSDDETNDATVVDVEFLQNQLTEQTNVLGAKNLCPNNATAQSKDGITYTINADKSITANGTNSKAQQTSIDVALKLSLNPGIYYLSGCTNADAPIYYGIKNASDNSAVTSGRDTGDGATFTILSGQYVNIYVEVSASKTVSNVKYYPMIRLASDPDDTYVPYAMTNRELTTTALKLAVLSDSVSIAADATETLNLRTNMSFKDFGFINVTAYDSNYIRGSLFTSRNPNNSKFNGIGIIYGGGQVRGAFTFNQLSDTSFSIINNTDTLLSFRIVGIGGIMPS